MPPSHNPKREAVHIRQQWPDLPPGAVQKFARLIASGWYIGAYQRLSQRRYLCTGRLSNWAGGANRYGRPLTKEVRIP